MAESAPPNPIPEDQAQCRAELKRLNKARKTLDKDDFDGKAELSKQIKAVKAQLGELQRATAGTEPVQQTPTAHRRPDHAGTITIAEVGAHEAAEVDFATTLELPHYLRDAWVPILRDVMGREIIRLHATDDNGRLLGILPLGVTRSKLFGNFGISLPYVNYGGAAGVADNVEMALIQHAFDNVSNWGLSHIELRDDKPRDGLPARTDKVTMLLDLQAFDHFDNYLQFVGSKVRAQVKKAQRSTLDLKWGQLELLADFYKVFSHNMRDLGTPVYTRRLFASILETFAADTALVVGYVAGRPVCCAFLLNNRGDWEIPWASTLRSANKIDANMAMYAYILRQVIERKGRQFDFGRSSQDASTFKFKRQWKAQPKQLYWHYSDQSRATSLTTDNPKYALAIKAWQHLPVGLTRIIGPPLVAQLP